MCGHNVTGHSSFYLLYSLNKPAQNAITTKKKDGLQVPAYDRFINERFERCLDLYLCPRTRKKRVFVKDPETLVPKLPKPQDLQPFPTTAIMQYIGHTAPVSLSIPSALSFFAHKKGELYLAHDQQDKSLVWKRWHNSCKLRSLSVERMFSPRIMSKRGSYHQ